MIVRLFNIEDNGVCPGVLTNGSFSPCDASLVEVKLSAEPRGNCFFRRESGLEVDKEMADESRLQPLLQNSLNFQ